MKIVLLGTGLIGIITFPLFSKYGLYASVVVGFLMILGGVLIGTLMDLYIEEKNEKKQVVESLRKLVTGHEEFIKISSEFLTVIRESTSIIVETQHNSNELLIKNFVETSKTYNSDILAYIKQNNNLLTKYEEKTQSFYTGLSKLKSQLEDVFAKRVEEEYQLTVKMKEETVEKLIQINDSMVQLQQRLKEFIDAQFSLQTNFQNKIIDQVKELKNLMDENQEQMKDTFTESVDKLRRTNETSINDISAIHGNILQTVQEQKNLHDTTMKAFEQYHKDLLDLGREDIKWMEKVVNV